MAYTLVNIDDFYIAFNVKPGNEMVEKTVHNIPQPCWETLLVRADQNEFEFIVIVTEKIWFKSSIEKFELWLGLQNRLSFSVVLFDFLGLSTISIIRYFGEHFG